jgi:hypothetical protein
MRPRTEPSLSKDPSQSSRLLEELKLDKQERIARVLQRNRPSAKLTMLKVDLVPNNNALLLQHAHPTFKAAVDHQALQVELVFLVNTEQFRFNSYEITHNC